MNSKDPTWEKDGIPLPEPRQRNVADWLRLMSALLRLTDSSRTSRHVRKVPRADLSNCNKRGLFDHFVGAQQGRR
jgi:hypothetical protein